MFINRAFNSVRLHITHPASRGSSAGHVRKEIKTHKIWNIDKMLASLST